MDMHGPSSDPSSQSGTSAAAAAAAAAAHRWYADGGPRMEPTGNLIVPDDMDVFFHSMSDGSGNHVNPASYYASPAAAAAARAAAVHSYRPSPHARVTGGQVCRPHFHSPLHPWISAADAKPPMVPHPAHHAGPAWCSPFPSKPSPHHPSPPGIGVHHGPSAPSHSSPHLFSFPPTPPKDATPDNVSGANPPTSSAPGSLSGSASGTSNDFGSSANSVACSSVANDTSTAASEMKPYYVGASHPNMITSFGSALSNCSSSKPREGSANFSSTLNQSAHHHPSSMNPYHHAHYGSGSAGQPTSAAELSGSSPYGFPHHPHHSASSLLSAKNMQNTPSVSNKQSQRTKGRSSAGKRRARIAPQIYTI